MSFELSITQLAQAAKAIEVIGNSNSPITKLVMDSRKIISPSHAAFIAIKGEHHDGHHYIEDAYKAGIHVFLIEEKSIRIFNRCNSCFCTYFYAVFNFNLHK